ncbi:ATP-binding cassette domain-containing protein [Reinekea blandensis]|uniref:ABC transporter:TOBE n=1 Tax=Reinekea blandensis MED297 TaxID=314283 RepID=A4BI46_9GAMM|nr:ATP-binding cassette domain-containing protein [Reinekea blandensis]EAR08189.1 ABC transporter:TOBE [Reinekea sp. MED297] [Reinekea blandensis MED297]
MKFFIHHQPSGLTSVRFEGEFEAGARVALLGHSGAGKTTLMRYLSGLERRGSVRIETGAGKNPVPWRSDVVYLHQSPIMFAHHRVEQTMAFAQRFARQEQLPIRRWADMLELTELWSRPCTELSGGQQQRVALLRGLMTGKPWLLLDEAFSALDGARLLRACDVVEDFCRLTGAGLILASHQDRPQRILCNEAYVVNHLSGQHEPNLFTALNRRAGEPRKTTLKVEAEHTEHGFLRTDCGGVPLYVAVPERWREGSARVSIAAGDVSIAIGAEHQTSMVNRLPVNVQQISDWEGRVLLSLSIGSQTLEAIISKFSAERLALQVHQPVFAEFKVGAVEWNGQIECTESV